MQTKAGGYSEQHDCRCMQQRLSGPSTAYCTAIRVSGLPLHRALTKRFRVTAALSRRSRTGDKCNRLVTSELQLSCNKLVLFDTELKTAKFSTAVHRYMYCAIDEAGSHVGSKSFRPIVGVYSQTQKDLLGSACSPAYPSYGQQ